MKVTLFITEGPEAGRTFVFHEPDTFLVGRTQKAHLRFDQKADRLISRTHFLMEITPPRLVITDLFSKNGTFVNGKRIQRQELQHGDEIRVGKTAIQVEVEVDRGERVLDLGDTHGRDDDIITESRLDQIEPEDLNPPSPMPTPSPVVSSDGYQCQACGADVTAQARSDGLAEELAGASYLCGKCALKDEKPDVEIERPIDYTILNEIGRGGMGIVYKAAHRPTSRVVALKVIRPDMAMSEYATKVFEREIEVQSKVIHPHLVRVLDQGTCGRTPFFVTEYLSGGDVKNLVDWEFQGPVEPGLACRITLQILSGLSALHGAGFIHRDLKPSNYLLDRAYSEAGLLVKIADYGLAKSFETAGNSLFDYTREGVAAGSYAFIPPEQIINYKFVKPPVDVYAVGASLFYMLTAKYPVDFSAVNAKGRHPLQVVLEDAAQPLESRRPDLPSALTAVVNRALAKDMTHRYPTADAFRIDLENTVRQEGWMQPV